MTRQTLQGSAALDEWRKVYNPEKFKREEDKKKALDMPIAHTRSKVKMPAFSL